MGAFCAGGGARPQATPRHQSGCTLVGPPAAGPWQPQTNEASVTQRSVHPSGGLWQQGRLCGRRGAAAVRAVLPDQSPIESADPSVVWQVLQQVWQSLTDAASRGPPSDDGISAALHSTGTSACRTLLALHLLRSGASTAQLVSSLQGSGATGSGSGNGSGGTSSSAQAGRSNLAGMQRRARTRAGASARDPGSAPSTGGGRASSVQPPAAAAQMGAGQGSTASSGGGGGGKAAKARRPDIGTLWGLLVLGLVRL